MKREDGNDVIVLGAGCFWGVEDALGLLPGVVATRVGYAGGRVATPTYEEVCGGTTGHAEVVEVTFDPAATTLEELLGFFWTRHPATGPSFGQYRSIVVCRQDQVARVRAVKAAVESTVPNGESVTTEILVGAPFYEAEEYHQHYYERHRATLREVRSRCGLPPDE